MTPEDRRAQQVAQHAPVADALRLVGIPASDEEPQPSSYELLDWWEKHAKVSAERTVPKAIEYGSTDLEWMGRILLGMVKSKSSHPGVEVEMGCAVYALGKLLRIIAALCDGVEPSVDSWFDLEIYATMAQHAREFGSWPAEGML